jgi:hypothetical protein
MVTRITLGKHGLPEYLENGIKSGSTLSREEKDTRIQIDGSIDALKDSIKFCQSKGWKNSYYHLTLSFTHEEWEAIEKEEGRAQEVVQRYLSLMFPNHDVEQELCYHAEAHVPLIKYEPFVPRGKNDPRVGTEGDMMERYPHIHIGISLQNMQYSRQIAAGGILGRANSKDSEIFKQCCDEILSAEFDLIDAVARAGKEDIKRSSYEENFKVWKRFEHAATQRTKGKELLATFTEKDFTEMVFEDLTPKIIEPIKVKEEPKLSDIAATRLKNLNQIYNPSEFEKKLDSAIFKKLRETDVDKFIPYFAAYFSIPSEKLRKHESQNKLELYRNSSKKWVKFSITDFCTQELKLNKDETIKLLSIFSTLESSGKGVEGLYGVLKDRRYVKNIANTAMDDLGWKFQNLPKVSLSVCRDLGSHIPNAEEKKAKNPKKPTYSAYRGYRVESNSLVDWANELDSEKIAGYSVANFKHGIRRNDNIESLNPIVILDVDNHVGQEQLTIEDVKEKLEAKNISALLIPTASHSKEVNRFRAIIPTAKAFQIQGEYENWKDDYSMYIQSFVDSLGLDETKAKAIDAIKATPAQFYYGSPSDAMAVLTHGTTFDNSQILDAVYNERERINADINLRNQEKDYGIAKKEVEVYAQDLDSKLSKLDEQDNDKALSRTVISNINSTINILDAARLKYPNAKIIKEGRYEILYTGDIGRDGNRNLLAKYGAFNFTTQKIRTPFDFMREYLELINDRIKEFGSLFVTLDRKTKLKDFLLGSLVVKKTSEQPLEFARVDIHNTNNYAKLIKQQFPDKYSQVCLLNYAGIAKNLQKYMKSINDNEGLEQFKNHYGLKFVDIKNGRIGFRTDLSLEELKAHGLSSEWLNPPKPKPIQKEFKTPAPAIKISNNDEMNF